MVLEKSLTEISPSVPLLFNNPLICCSDPSGSSSEKNPVSSLMTKLWELRGVELVVILLCVYLLS